MGARTAGLYGVTCGRETPITQTSTQLFRASRSLFSPAPVVVVQLVGVLTLSRRCRASTPWLLRPVLLKQLLAPVETHA